MYLKLLLSLFAVSFAYSDWEYAIPYYHFKHNTRNVKVSRINRSGEKVDVRLYYESLCPFCRDFYTSTLNKTIAELGAYIHLKTYPYGNAQKREVNGTTVIECQHGPEECYGNKLHACAIDEIKHTTQAVYYISCMIAGQMGTAGSTDKDATECGKQMGIDAKHIIKCAKGERGEELLEYYGRETDKDVPDKKGVPWPLVNGKHFDGIVENDKFVAAICAALENPPPQCNQ